MSLYHIIKVTFWHILLLAILPDKQDIINGSRRSSTSLDPLEVLISFTISLRTCSISSRLDDPIFWIEMGQRYKLRARTSHSLDPLRSLILLMQWVHYIILISSIFGKEIVLFAGCIADWKPNTLMLLHRILQFAQPNIFALRHMFLFDENAWVCVLLLCGAISH